MGEGPFLNTNFRKAVLLLFCLLESQSISLGMVPVVQVRSLQMAEMESGLFPDVSPRGAPNPFVPLLAPSPLTPFANSTIPALSGLLESQSKSLGMVPVVQVRSLQMAETESCLFPYVSPRGAPNPFVPLIAPSPLTPFANSTVPALSGLCTLNFSAVDSMLSMTAIDCWASFAPFLANVICCPQLQATLTVLIGQTSKDTGMLALDATHSNHCLSDVQQILTSQGANENLRQICSLSPSNLTEASCPINNLSVAGFESSVDASKLLAACKKVDPVKECCTQVCQNAISEAARSISLKDGGPMNLNGTHNLPSRVEDCKSVVLRWLASRLDPNSANQVLRRLSNCNVNKACPLVFPATGNVSNDCGNTISNQTACCKTMENYISHLQRQSFITNLQALDCAALLGVQLQKANISENVYNLCHITLKDFSLQVGSQESGCLLPSLPSDATFDQSSGISFTCDLNDNIAAPWPSSSEVSISSCNNTISLPALPAATSAHEGPIGEPVLLSLLFASFLVLFAL